MVQSKRMIDLDDEGADSKVEVDDAVGPHVMIEFWRSRASRLTSVTGVSLLFLKWLHSNIVVLSQNNCEMETAN